MFNQPGRKKITRSPLSPGPIPVSIPAPDPLPQRHRSDFPMKPREEVVRPTTI